MNRELIEVEQFTYNYDIKTSTKKSKLSKLEGRACFILATDVNEKSVADLRRILKTTNYRQSFGTFGYIHIGDGHLVVYNGNKTLLNIPTSSVDSCDISFTTEVITRKKNIVGKLYIFKFTYYNPLLSSVMKKYYTGTKYIVLMV